MSLWLSLCVNYFYKHTVFQTSPQVMVTYLQVGWIQAVKDDSLVHKNKNISKKRKQITSKNLFKNLIILNVVHKKSVMLDSHWITGCMCSCNILLVKYIFLLWLLEFSKMVQEFVQRVFLNLSSKMVGQVILVALTEHNTPTLSRNSTLCIGLLSSLNQRKLFWVFKLEWLLRKAMFPPPPCKISHRSFLSPSFPYAILAQLQIYMASNEAVLCFCVHMTVTHWLAGIISLRFSWFSNSERICIHSCFL
jgi:hypothetical protein